MGELDKYILPLEAVKPANVKSLVEQRLDKYYEYEILIEDPEKGMLANGFSEERLIEAREQVDEMIDFYEELLEQW